MPWTIFLWREKIDYWIIFSLTVQSSRKIATSLLYQESFKKKKTFVYSQALGCIPKLRALRNLTFQKNPTTHEIFTGTLCFSNILKCTVPNDSFSINLLPTDINISEKYLPSSHILSLDRDTHFFVNSCEVQIKEPLWLWNTWRFICKTIAILLSYNLNWYCYYS